MIYMIITQCVFIFLATFGFSILFNIDKEELFLCASTGVICFFIYKIFEVYFYKDFLGAILGTFVGTLTARRFAFLRKMPAAIYIIPAIIPLVPGGAIYLTMRSALASEYMNILKYSFLAMRISGSIVIGMSLALSLPSKWFNYNITEKKR